jgi:tyrosine-protein kinase Etk/Wzc
MKSVLATTDGNDLRATTVADELGYLWSNLLQRGVADGHRTIGFCAIGDSEGGHGLVGSLALLLGSRGKHVALVEATLRAATLSPLFEVSGAPGLADVLAGRGDLQDALRPQVAPGVDLVTGGAASDPFWGFTSDRFRALLDELLATRVLCLVDVPALNRAPEAALVIRALDAVVLVVEANRHRADVVRRNVAFLRSLGTPFLGAVLTDLVHELPTRLARLC